MSVVIATGTLQVKGDGVQQGSFVAAVVFVDKFSKMTHIAPTVQECTGADVAHLY